MGTPQEDEATVDRVLQGDVSAFAEIVRRWQGPLINLAFRFCGDRGRSEEMAQEAFLRTFRGLAQWRRDAAFSTWLFALATNVYRTQMRRIPPRTAAFGVALWNIAQALNDPGTITAFEEQIRAFMAFGSSEEMLWLAAAIVLTGLSMGLPLLLMRSRVS